MIAAPTEDIRTNTICKKMHSIVEYGECNQK